MGNTVVYTKIYKVKCHTCKTGCSVHLISCLNIITIAVSAWKKFKSKLCSFLC